MFNYSVNERLKLIQTARGLLPADIVIVNANLVSVTTGEVLEDMGIAIKGKRIARIGRTSELRKLIGDQTLVIDAENKYVSPGFIDPHIHIESSMLSPTGFAILALKHGTTTVVADPHEIGNVLGLKGIKIFIDEALRLPLKILIDIPSCVPPTDPNYGLESINNVISAKEIEELVHIKSVMGLGEVMDFVSIINGNSNALEKIRIAKNSGLWVNGHAPLLSGGDLDAYISAGILSDHETTRFSEAVEKLRKGMFVFIREGSAWKDLKQLSKLLLDDNIDCKLCCFTSDDLNVMDLYEKGHMDRIINEAIELGVEPIKAIQLATINPAIYLGLVEHIGVIAPGRLADLVVFDNIHYIKPETVIANGEIIYYKSELKKRIEPYSYPEDVLKTVNLSREITPEDLAPKAPPTSSEYVKAVVIEVTPRSTLTRKSVEKLPVKNGYLSSVPERDIIYVAVIERHRGLNNIGKGFVKGLGFRGGAIAQTIAHDTHNIIVAGSNLSDMAIAVKRLVENQGGIVVIDNGKVVSEVKLQYGGLMSIEDPEKVYTDYRNMIKSIKKSYGIEFEHFFMTLSLISLPVIPEIRLTDRGLVDVKNARLIPLIIG